MSRKRAIASLISLVITTSACGGLTGSGAATSTVAATSAPAATATPAARSAQLSELQNTVQSREPPSAEWQAAAEGQQVAAGGGVKTGEAARAKVSLSDGTIIRLAPATEFELTELSPQPTDPVTQLKLTAGKMWVIVTKALGGGAFDIETPSGVATVRGSLMSTEFYPADGRMIVTCLDGQCRLQSATSGKFVDLSGGQQSGIPAYGRDPGAIITINVNQVSDWAREVPEAASLVATITPGPPPTETPAPAP